jgi:hypothetical protein
MRGDANFIHPLGVLSVLRLTSGPPPDPLPKGILCRPEGNSMLASARPKRWGVFRQKKGREFDPNKVEFLTLPT